MLSKRELPFKTGKCKIVPQAHHSLHTVRCHSQPWRGPEGTFIRQAFAAYFEIGGRNHCCGENFLPPFTPAPLSAQSQQREGALLLSLPVRAQSQHLCRRPRHSRASARHSRALQRDVILIWGHSFSGVSDTGFPTRALVWIVLRNAVQLQENRPMGWNIADVSWQCPFLKIQSVELLGPKER